VRDNISAAAFFSEYLSIQKPVLIRNAMKGVNAT
jgi:hypothetical protein